MSFVTFRCRIKITIQHYVFQCGIQLSHIIYLIIIYFFPNVNLFTTLQKGLWQQQYLVVSNHCTIHNCIASQKLFCDKIIDFQCVKSNKLKLTNITFRPLSSTPNCHSYGQNVNCKFELIGFDILKINDLTVPTKSKHCSTFSQGLLWLSIA